jgi:hypothetical protein
VVCEGVDGRVIWAVFSLIGGVIVSGGLVLLVAASCREGVVGNEGLAWLVLASYGGEGSCAGVWGGSLSVAVGGGGQEGEVMGCL